MRKRKEKNPDLTKDAESRMLEGMRGMRLAPVGITASGLAVLLFSSCQQTAPAGVNPNARNGRLAFGYEAFVNNSEYRYSRDIWRNDERLARADGRNGRVEILRDMQRGRLFIDGAIAMDFPVCTGKSGKSTPRGTFKIQQKVKDYHSNLYGAVFDASGKLVNGNATPSTPVPAGGRYAPAAMPYWMRINGPIGMHVGNVYRDEESHGCIRIPKEACGVLFDTLALGTPVVVQ